MPAKKYGVVVCSMCKRAWGITLSQKTTKCPICGKRYDVSQRRILYQTADHNKVQRAVASLQKRIS